MSADTGGSKDVSSRKALLILVGTVLVALLLAWINMRSNSETEEKTSPPTSTQGVTVAPQNGGTAGGVLPSPSSSVQLPNGGDTDPVIGNSPAEDPSASHTGDDAGVIGENTPIPGFKSTSDRKASAADQPVAKTLLAASMPTWAAYDWKDGEDSQSVWLANLNRAKAISNTPFYRQSKNQVRALWGTLWLSDMRARDATIVSQRQLWNVGSHSLWRVSIERKLVPGGVQPASAGGTEEVTWDILIGQNGVDDFTLISFIEPDVKNTSPKTFYRSPEGER